MVIKKDKIIIYCDGACSGNQFKNNVGGWSAILIHNSQRKEISGAEENSTNQRMELLACINALQNIKNKNIPIEIYSDSAYLTNCINHKWYEKWRLNNWKNSKKLPVENRDLWEKILKFIEIFEIKFNKVEGHAGVKENEKADKLAKDAIKTFIANSLR